MVGGGLVVIGSGGHAKVVIATAHACGVWVEGVYDDDGERVGSTVLGVPILGTVRQLLAGGPRTGIIAIGDNRNRKRIAECGLPMVWATLTHPSAVVHESVVLGEGTVVFAGAVVQPGSILGDHVIVNTHASVDHDCRLDDFVHVAPGACLAGGVQVREGAFLGTAAAVVPCKTIGPWAVVGAGALALLDVPNGETAVGIPAKVLARR